MRSLFWILAAVVGAGLLLLMLNGAGSQGFDEDQTMRALYLGIWCAVIAAGLLGSGMRLGEVARNLGVWLLIALALVAGYQYRYELQDIASRITAGLVPGSPLSVTSVDGIRTVMLDKAGNGHFETRAMIDGTSIRMLVDTGATTTMLTAADAARIGLDPEGLSYSVPVMTANGAARAARTTVDAMEVGAIVRRNVPVLVAERGVLDRSLLGMNFIGTLSGFEIRGDRMILTD